MKEPLVSIIIPTYNSSRFILDTLESARIQTYQNLELIITDDASTDNTAEVCKQWLTENKTRFRRTELLLAGQNGGTSVNCNRGIRAARGEWIKFISGDDALVNDAIEKLVRFVNENRNIKVLDSKVDIYNHDFSEIIGHMDRGDDKFFSDDTTALQQQKMIANNLKSMRIISSVGAFYSRELLNRVGGYTERFRFLEDALLYHKIFEAGEKFWYLDEVIYKYRRHSDALSLIDNNKDKIFSDLEIEIHQHSGRIISDW